MEEILKVLNNHIRCQNARIEAFEYNENCLREALNKADKDCLALQATLFRAHQLIKECNEARITGGLSTDTCSKLVAWAREEDPTKL